MCQVSIVTHGSISIIVTC